MKFSRMMSSVRQIRAHKTFKLIVRTAGQCALGFAVGMLLAVDNAYAQTTGGGTGTGGFAQYVIGKIKNVDFSSGVPVVAALAGTVGAGKSGYSLYTNWDEGDKFSDHTKTIGALVGSSVLLGFGGLTLALQNT